MNTVLPVANCADDGTSGTLRSVVAAANSGDTVDLSQLACGTITLQAGQIEIFVDDLAIVGPGRDALSLDGAFKARVLHHTGLGTLTLRDLSVRHGLADEVAQNPDLNRAGSGGCILSDHSVGNDAPSGGSLVMINAEVSDCLAVASYFSAFGGAVSAAGPVTLQNTTVSNSHVLQGATGPGGGGGGISVRNGSLMLLESRISGNTAQSTVAQTSGGGVRVDASGQKSTGAALASTRSTIENNFAGCSSAGCGDVAASGGGVFVVDGPLFMTSTLVVNNSVRGTVYSGGGGIWSYGGVRLTDTTVSGNGALRLRNDATHAVGGGMFAARGDAFVQASTIDSNVAGIGGGIFAGYQSALKVLNSTISTNDAEQEGGGIFNGAHGAFPAGTLAAPLLLVSSTITANTSGGLGVAGVVDTHNAYESAGFSDFESSIIARNTSGLPGGDANLVAGSEIIGANNLIDIAYCCTGTTVPPWLPPDTLSGDPKLGPLAYNGGPTRTHALSWVSPAINAGNNFAGVVFDQRGDGYPRAVGDAPDIGAYESGNEDIYTNPDLISSIGFE